MPKKSENEKGKSGGTTRRKFRITADPVIPVTEPDDAHKFELTEGEPPVPEFEDLGELNTQYRSNTVFLVARDPNWLFCYWDIDWEAHRLPGAVMLRLFCEADLETETEIEPSAPNWYLPARKQSATYSVEIGGHDTAGAWVAVARSNQTVTPSSSLGPESHPEFATVPFDVAFQRMLEAVRSHALPGEALAETIARLQQAGSTIRRTKLTAEQKQALAEVLGTAVSSGEGMDSARSAESLRAALEERLGSESASELMAHGWHIGELGSLSSAILAKWWKPGELSGLFSALGGWGPGIASSVGVWWPGFSGAALLGGLSSGETFGGLSSAGFGSEIMARSAFASAMASWFGARGAFGSEVTSLFAAPGASWSGQPFSQPERGFFMHVNAEVIFYGGTDPAARVWVNDEAIQLRPDGTFSYHFRFPDGDYRIRIVAESPDGVERRSATMSFERGTERAGDVGHTAQPAHLREPMGRA
jgi:hypothetical protein